MRHIRQPEGTNLCGQACLAMLGNMTLYQAAFFLGTKGSTTTKRMVEALRAMGFKCESKLKRTSNDGALPPFSTCLVNVGFDKPYGSHWIIWNSKEQRFYDPGFPDSVEEEFYYEKGGRITSYLEISRKEKKECANGERQKISKLKFQQIYLLQKEKNGKQQELTNA